MTDALTQIKNLNKLLADAEKARADAAVLAAIRAQIEGLEAADKASLSAVRVSESTVMDIAANTVEAYSRHRYTDAGWFGTIRYLLKRGLAPNRVEAILRSKHMRWAADSANRDDSVTVADFVAYYRTNPNHFTAAEVAKL